MVNRSQRRLSANKASIWTLIKCVMSMLMSSSKRFVSSSSSSFVENELKYKYFCKHVWKAKALSTIMISIEVQTMKPAITCINMIQMNDTSIANTIPLFSKKSKKKKINFQNWIERMVNCSKVSSTRTSKWTSTSAQRLQWYALQWLWPWSKAPNLCQIRQKRKQKGLLISLLFSLFFFSSLTL